MLLFQLVKLHLCPDEGSRCQHIISRKGMPVVFLKDVEDEKQHQEMKYKTNPFNMNILVF